MILYNSLELSHHRKWRSRAGSVVSDGVIIMVKRVSSRNRRKGHVRPRNVTRRVNKDEKATAEMQVVLGRAQPTPTKPGEGSAESS